ncbi:proline-rich transmembrane protein 1-like [Xyrichtys novacula]|uniref:Proline-rich transmembrane protein 1-like n=1 Tax=Xyrichtys novacula TaxID=13765 RepID=A0AAV1FMM9_XYRNO|nr:proline-rich transmembrane protein 1-like [Xyrichtys novacula]
MDPNYSAGAPTVEGSGEKSSMGQAAPPPYQANPAAWAPQPGPGYPPQSGPGYPPQPQGYGAPPQQYGAPGYGQQPYPAGQPYPGQTVVVQPKHYVVPTPLQNPVNDYLAYSIFTMLCCCLPLGIAALIYSITTREANHTGDQLGAERSSRMARTLNHVGLGIGLGTIILCIVYAVVVGALVSQ